VRPLLALPLRRRESRADVTVPSGAGTERGPLARLRVLLVPDSIYWVTGTIAKSIARFNPMVSATIISAPVLEQLWLEKRDIIDHFDLAHFVCPFASRRWLARLRDRMPVVTSHHHVTDWSELEHNLEGDAIIAGSTQWARDVESRGADSNRVFYVPYGVDTELFMPPTAASRARTEKELGLEDSGPVVGFFAKRGSNDDDRKGTDVFVDALVRLHALDKGTAALIIGPGWEAMAGEFRERGIRCRWVPYVNDYNDMPGFYGALDFYWVTARVEGGPVTLLEAMSCEVCVVSTPVGLALDVVKDGVNGVLLPMDDAPAFASRTFSLWQTPSERERLGGDARAKMRQVMDVRITAMGVIGAYRTAIENFAKRTGQVVGSLDKGAAIATPRLAATGSTTQSDVPLEGIPASLRRRVAMLETLVWAEHINLEPGHKLSALSLMARAWRRNPFSPEPLRRALRSFLPRFVVAGVVSAKKLIGGR
jgi:glycosyltransferase involved in cell wall biosynthesis